MKSLLVGSYLTILVVLAVFLVFDQPELSSEVMRYAERFQPERALADLREIDALSRPAGGRNVGSPGNALAAQYVGRQLERAGLTVYEQAFHDPMGGSMKNIIGVLPGGRDEMILICGHHDADGPNEAVRGAAGLAVLLELARVSAAGAGEGRKEGQSQSRTLMFASWDGESMGCAGSTHFVDSLSVKAKNDVRAVLCLDSLGSRDGTVVVHALRYQDRFGVESIAPDWLVTRVSNAARARGASLPVGDPWLGLLYQVVVRAVDVGYYSDDRPFLIQGVPAVFISDFSLMSPRPESGEDLDSIDPARERQLASIGRSLEAALTDLMTASELPAGEQDYVVIRPAFFRTLRLTSDQVRMIAVLCLLPGAVILIRRRRDGGLVVTRALFFAFSSIFLLATLRADAVLFAALFVPPLLAGPLLAIRRAEAVWWHMTSLLPALLFGGLLLLVCATGSAPLVRVSGVEAAAMGGLLLLGLAQTPLHLGRLKPARRS